MESSKSKQSHGTICVYSIYSFYLYSILPITLLANKNGIPNLIAIITTLFSSLIFRVLVFILEGRYVILTDHSKPDHPHDKFTTIGVVWRSIVLGIILTIGLEIINSNRSEYPNINIFGYYLVLLSFFHFSEFFVTSLTNPKTLRPASFLLEQSLAYALAMVASSMEFAIESSLVPKLKTFSVISYSGLALAVFGEIVRKLAMFTAGQNFTHTISTRKSSDHELVCHGIYSVFRHPSYAGWFYWAVGTQLLLLNPICAILFTGISRSFFKNRIEYEENYLEQFFGDNYKRYKSRVGVWIPL